MVSRQIGVKIKSYLNPPRIVIHHTVDASELQLFHPKFARFYPTLSLGNDGEKFDVFLHILGP